MEKLNRHPALLVVHVAAVACLSLVGCGPSAGPEPPRASAKPSVKILFVGDSITAWNGGLGGHIEQLAASRNPPRHIEADQVTQFGAPLEFLWKDTDARQEIRQNAYDFVVLQEDLPETDVDSFHEYARRFEKVIRESGAEPVLFMAWSYERLGWISQEEIVQAHDEIATELRVDVAPVGLAWQRAMEERPDLDLFASDREHPSMQGTFLAINVVYAALFGESPIGLPYLPSDSVPEADAAFLQRVAWNTEQEFRMQE
jgi:hypothetical protein